MPGGSEGPPRAESAPSAPRTRKQTAAEAGALAETYSEILGGGASAGERMRRHDSGAETTDTWAQRSWTARVTAMARARR